MKSKDYSINQQPTYQQKYIPVLMYHQIKDQIGITKEEISIGVSKTLFEEQIKALLNAGLPNKPFIILLLWQRRSNRKSDILNTSKQII
ncbi:hypothetical protein PBV87_09810 [Niameybacter massiliensis]|uniref:Uncharacterized protein n=1 Tax=Holtiella tumoricola TaxID=3018743 RepID=A0AA42DMW1_9FIRM|nr:hypothetical protein [Holtiella tumoricola]MDA3731772.1 hypothetical protein [Holtiella tumoricola]